MNTFHHLLVVTVLMAMAQPAMAQRYSLDDSLSPQQVYSLSLEWRPHEIGRAIQDVTDLRRHRVSACFFDSNLDFAR